MTDLARQSGDVEHPSQDSKTIDQAEREATTQIFALTTKAVQEAIDTAVTDAEKITNPQTKRYYVPFLEQMLGLYGREMLEQAQNSIDHVQEVAQAYRSRIYY